MLTASGASMNVESASAGCVLDIAGTLARLGGDRQLFSEMAAFFFEDAPRLYFELRAAVQRRDAADIRMSAHALKGLVAGCGGVRTANAAQKVETAGQENNLNNIEPLVETLGDELELLTQALEAYHR
jgi:HPt (histidine-containing phosphotransfer) domain-containing protein